MVGPKSLHGNHAYETRVVEKSTYNMYIVTHTYIYVNIHMKMYTPTYVHNTYIVCSDPIL